MRTTWLVIMILAAVCSCAPRARPARVPAGEDQRAVRGADNGLEVISWPVEDSTGAIGRTLASHADSTPLPPDQQAQWRRAGLRLLSVPEERLEALLTDLHPGGPVQRQWFGLLPGWTPVARGPSWEGERTIGAERTAGAASAEASAFGEFILGPGRLRLLARCWNEPVIEARSSAVAAVLHLELLPQHEESVPRARRLTIGVGGPRSIEDEGMLLRGLGIVFAARRGMAYLIVPESPAAEWCPVEETSTDRPGLPVPPGTGRLVAPTVGEAMLSDAPASGHARRRLILVLVPRVPEAFELIQAPAPAGASSRGSVR